MKRAAAATIALLALAGCAVGPNYRQPTPLPAVTGRLAEPAPGGAAAASAAPAPSRWWRLFDDALLDKLVDDALRHNTDVRVAAANLRRARFVLAEARAGRLPTTDVSAQYTHARTGIASIPASSGTTIGATETTGIVTDPTTGATTGAAALPNGFVSDFYTAGLDVAYEVDLFGRVSRSIEAARGDYQSAAAALDAARIAVAADTARAYAAACGYEAQAATARETVRLQANTVDLTQRLFQGGRGTRRDVDQAQTLYEQAQAAVPSLEAERRASLYALAVLTGRAPADLEPATLSCVATPRVTRPFPTGDGAALLARRPDVREAERKLAADTARIGVATADLYPSITLLGGVSIGASHFGDLGKSKSFSYSLGPMLSWSFPIQSAARARIHQAEATAQASLASFDGAVLTALRETEQALARLDGEMKRNAALARAYAAAADAAQLSRYRFDFGSDSFLQLLDAERTRADASAQLAESNATLADDQVELFRALGGGWEEAPPVAERADPVTPFRAPLTR